MQSTTLETDLKLLEEWHPKHRVLAAAKIGERLDGRNHNEGRPIDLQRNIFKKVYGSSSIRRGKSYYFSCATASIGLTGVTKSLPIEIKLQLPHILGCEFGLNRQSDAHMKGENVEMTLNTWTDCVCDQVSRILSNSIDPSILNIPDEEDTEQSKDLGDNKNSPGSGTASDALSYRWLVQIDVTCLNYEGNLFDQVLLCALGALIDLKLPHVVWDDERKWWKPESAGKSLPNMLVYLPIPVTVYRLSSGTVLIDGDRDEGSVGVPSTIVYFVPQIFPEMNIKENEESVLVNLISAPRAGLDCFADVRRLIDYCESSAASIFRLVKQLTERG